MVMQFSSPFLPVMMLKLVVVKKMPDIFYQKLKWGQQVVMLLSSSGREIGVGQSKLVNAS